MPLVVRAGLQWPTWLALLVVLPWSSEPWAPRASPWAARLASWDVLQPPLGLLRLPLKPQRLASPLPPRQPVRLPPDHTAPPPPRPCPCPCPHPQTPRPPPRPSLAPGHCPAAPGYRSPQQRGPAPDRPAQALRQQQPTRQPPRPAETARSRARSGTSRPPPGLCARPRPSTGPPPPRCVGSSGPWRPGSPGGGASWWGSSAWSWGRSFGCPGRAERCRSGCSCSCGGPGGSGVLGRPRRGGLSPWQTGRLRRATWAGG